MQSLFLSIIFLLFFWFIVLFSLFFLISFSFKSKVPPTSKTAPASSHYTAHKSSNVLSTHFLNINSSFFANISAWVARLCTIFASPLFAPSRFRINDATSLEKIHLPCIQAIVSCCWRWLVPFSV